MEKRNRAYKFLVEFSDQPITVEVALPFTIEFDVTRGSYGSCNAGIFRIYNLSKKNRDLLRCDQWSYNFNKKVTFIAGYEKNMPLVFTGEVQQAWSVREGTNFVTTLICNDGGDAYLNGKTNQQFPANTDQRNVIKNLADSLKENGVKTGSIGDFPGKTSRGNSYTGSTTEILTRLTNNGFFIDNGVAHCLNDNECIDGAPFTINSKSGLLGTPVREIDYVNFEMLFEPQLKIGHLIQIDSREASNFNNNYIVKSLKHSGIISYSVSGKATTHVGCLAGSFNPVTGEVKI